MVTCCELDGTSWLVSVFMSELVDVFTDAIKSHQPLSLSIMTRMHCIPSHLPLPTSYLHLIFLTKQWRLIYPSSPCENCRNVKHQRVVELLEPLLNIINKIY